MNQRIFVAMCQMEYYQTLLAPYIDHKPSPKAVAEEQKKMAQLRTKFKNMKSINLFEWDGKSKPYIET